MRSRWSATRFCDNTRMAVPLPDADVRRILTGYPAMLRGPGVDLGNYGGFSGARLWRIECGGGTLCLRAWPTPGPPAKRLQLIHRLMRRAREAGLEFVPAVFPTAAGATWVEHAGRLWELSTWQPGRADFQDQPTPARLEAACTALAGVHAAWKAIGPQHAPCPAVRRRLAAVREWQDLIRSGWRPAWRASDDPVTPWAERAWNAVQAQIDQVPHRLAAWVDRPVPLQPCLCDIWHDHVLFQGDAVTGLIDYGSVKLDHVAVDLARLLGSLLGAQLDAGLDHYSRFRRLTAEERDLVALLDQTGTLLGAANWLKWLYRDARFYPDRAAVARRLAGLVPRLEFSA